MSDRKKILIRTSWISIIGNILLSALKIIVGIISGSLAVLSDGIDSATDVVTSLVTLFTARIVNRPPDKKYAYGYEKADSIATKVLSMIIFFAGIQMLITSGKRIFHYEPHELPTRIAIYVTIFSMLGKLALAYYQFRQGKKAHSGMLIANAKNMRNDVLISSGVLVGLIFTFTLNMPVLDTITGLIISAYIIKTSIEIFIESNVILMDGMQDTSIYKKIFDAVEYVPGASNPHRVRDRKIGNMHMIVLDIEADGNISLNEAHDIAHAVEDSIKKEIEDVYDIVVHVEPKGKQHFQEKFGLSKDNL